MKRFGSVAREGFYLVGCIGLAVLVTYFDYSDGHYYNPISDPPRQMAIILSAYYYLILLMVRLLCRGAVWAFRAIAKPN